MEVGEGHGGNGVERPGYQSKVVFSTLGVICEDERSLGRKNGFQRDDG